MNLSIANVLPFVLPALGRVLLDAAVKSALVLAIAGLTVALMRRSSAAARHLVWFLATASLLVLPLLSWCLPGWHVLPGWTSLHPSPPVFDSAGEQAPSVMPPHLPDEPIRLVPPKEVSVPTFPRSHMIEPVVATHAPEPRRATSLFSALSPWKWGLVAWLAGAALALVPTALGLVSLWRLERAARPETEPAWLQLLHWLLDRLGLRRRVSLLKSPHRRMPMTWGILRPKLLLPEESEDWPEERRRVVLLHELAHAKRWDYLTNLITQFACALYWFNPLVWLASRQMVAERERACDDIVLRHGAKPADYAEQVLQIAAGLPLGRFAAYGGIAMARPSRLEGRLLAILDASRNRAALTRFAVVAVVFLLSLVLVPVAMMKAASAISQTPDTQTEVVVWQAIVNGAIVRQLDLTNQFPEKNLYNAYAPDGVKVKQTLRDALLSKADVELGETVQWLEHADSRPNSPSPFTLLSNTRQQESPDITLQTATMLCNGFGQFEPKGSNVEMTLKFTVNGQLQRLKPDRTGFESVETKPPQANIEWHSSVKTGSALCFVARLAGTLEGEFYHLVAFETVQTNRANAAQISRVTSSKRWLTGSDGTWASFETPDPSPTLVPISQVMKDLKVIEAARGDQAPPRRTTPPKVTVLRDGKTVRNIVPVQEAEAELARLTELHNANLASASELEATQRMVALLKAEAAGDAAATGRIKIQQAEADLARVQALREKNLVSETELQNAQAKLDLARAEASGDAAAAVRVRLQQAEADLARLAQLRRNNLVSATELEAVQGKVDLLKAEAAGDTNALGRVKIRLAESELARIEALHKDKFVSETELQDAQAKLELARGDATGDQAAVARIKLRAAEAELARATQLRTNALLSEGELRGAQARVEALRVELEDMRRNQPPPRFGPVLEREMKPPTGLERSPDETADALKLPPIDKIEEYTALTLQLEKLGKDRIDLGLRVNPLHPGMVMIQEQTKKIAQQKADLEKVYPAFLRLANYLNAGVAGDTNAAIAMDKVHVLEQVVLRTEKEIEKSKATLAVLEAEAGTSTNAQLRIATQVGLSGIQDLERQRAMQLEDLYFYVRGAAQVMIEALRAELQSTRTNQPLSRFGPVLEREMKPPAGLERSYLDLETGDFVTNAPPGDVTWLPGQSDVYSFGGVGSQILSDEDVARLIALNENGSRVRYGLSMAAVSVSSNRWDATAEEVLRELATQTNQAQVRLGGPESRRTWFFRTREETSGVLQIVPVEERPGAVRIRWKLVRTGEAPRVIGGSSNVLDNSEALVSVTIPVSYITAAEVVENIGPLLPASASLKTNQSGNALIVVATRSTLSRLEGIIRALDNPALTNQARRAFGPALEREMNLPDGLQRSYLDLETGEFVSSAPPGDVTFAWTESDLRVRHGLDMVAVDVSSNRWDATAEEVAAELSKWTPQKQVRLGGLESRRTWFFKTREGSMGVLQIVPVEEKPGTVRIRWKLLKSAESGGSRREEDPSSNPQSAMASPARTNPQSSQGLVTTAATPDPSPAAAQPSFGPMVECVITPGKGQFIYLDAGSFERPPDWRTSNGPPTRVMVGPDGHWFFGFGPMNVLIPTNADFNLVTSAQAIAAVASYDPAADDLHPGLADGLHPLETNAVETALFPFLIRPHEYSDRPLETNAFETALFRTKKGTIGVLQIKPNIPDQTNAAGVTVRFKLVQRNDTTQPRSGDSSTNSTSNPQSAIRNSQSSKSLVTSADTTASSPGGASARTPKTAEEIVAELRNILPEDWNCRLFNRPDEIVKAGDLNDDALFRIDFKNPSAWSEASHPNLQMYYFLTSEPERKQLRQLLSRLNRRGNLVIAEAPGCMVVMSISQNNFMPTPYLVRAIAPLGRTLEQYFGRPTDEQLRFMLGLVGHGAGGLTGASGFAGEVLDDQTSKPISKFNLEFDPEPARMGDGPLIDGALRAPTVFFGGRFALEGRLLGRRSGSTAHPPGDMAWEGLELWKPGQRVTVRIRAGGYQTQPITPEPVVWPVRLTNLVVRLKRADAQGQSASDPGSSRGEEAPSPSAESRVRSADSSQSLVTLPPAIYLNGRVVDDATGQPIIDFVVQRGSTNFTSPGEMFWQHYMMGDARVQNPGAWSGRMESQDQAVRILAPGYVPEILKKESFTNEQTSGLEIRLKRGDAVQGVVLDADGRPVGGAKVYLATVQRLFLMDGKFEYGAFRGDSTTTDDTGRFALRGEGGTTQKVVIASADNHLVWPVVQRDPKRAMRIALPNTGTLIVRYDIPGDALEAKPELRLITTNKEMPLWKDMSFGLSFTVTNRGETILTNLAPGTYSFRRWKSADHDHGAETERQIVQIEPGQTQPVDMVRTNGQRVSGKVIGLDQGPRSGGYIFVRSPEATGQPWPQRSRNEQKEMFFPNFDVLQFGADGTFQTAMLEPGAYTVIAHVYPPQASPGGFPYHPDFVGVAKVTITDEVMPPVPIKLAPALFTDIAGHALDDATGNPVEDLIIQSGTVNRQKPDEIIWSPGYQGMMQGFGVGAGQFSLRNEKEGSAFRFLANGYLPQAFTRNEVIASRQTANLQVRLKRGGELHGMVADHAGWPSAGVRVILAPFDLGEMPSKPISWGGQSGEGYTFATTDAAGHFSLRGVGGNQQRILVVSADGRLVQPVQPQMSGQELKITLPKPAALIVHYDIPGDLSEAYFALAIRTNEMAMPLWKDVNLNPGAYVPNGGQIVLNNLTPGTYDFSRSRMGGETNTRYAFLFGDPYKVVQSDFQRLVLESGQTQEVSVVRSVGQRVQGQVTGLEGITNSVGSFLYAGSATAISSPLDFRTNLEPCFDAVRLEKDGHFQTALLEPGTYTLVAEVYVWDEAKREPFSDDEPQYGGMSFMRPQQLAYVGSAKVTVTPNGAPPSVKIELSSNQRH